MLSRVSMCLFAQFILLHFSEVTFAQTQPQRAYARKAVNAQVIEACNASANGQEDLIPRNPDPLKVAFVAKPMWLIDKSTGQWIEAGSVKGWINKSGGSGSTEYWAGDYAALQRNIGNFRSYYAFKVGKINQTGTRNICIKRGNKLNANSSDYSWEVWIDGKKSQTMVSSLSSFNQMQLGIETNAKDSKFKSGTKATKIVFKSSSNPSQWIDWKNIQVINGDNNAITQWSSTYDKNSNTVNFIQK
jgi:hypothetical protein